MLSRFLVPATLVLVLAAQSPGFAAWTSYRRVPDGHLNAVYFRYNMTGETDSKGNHKIIYQFRNDYEGKAAFTAELTYTTHKGEETARLTETLKAGVESGTAGAVVFGSDVKSLKMLRIKFTKE